MALHTLLLSHDAEVLQVLRHVLDDLGVKVEVCTRAERADELLSRRKYDVVIIDVDDVPGASAVLHNMRKSASNRNTIAFAILNGVTSPQQAFELGANLALEKPLPVDLAIHSLRAACALGMRERRRYFRHKVDMPVNVALSEKAELQATATNVSEGGMALRVRTTLQVNAMVQLRFLLPGSKTWIGAGATVAWADEEGRAGVKFEHLSSSAREELERWLTQRMRQIEPDALVRLAEDSKQWKPRF